MGGPADIDHRGAVPGKLGGQLGGPVGRTACRKKNMVRTATIGELAQRLLYGHHALAGGRGTQHGACLLGQPTPLADHVQANDPDPGRDEQTDH